MPLFIAFSSVVAHSDGSLGDKIGAEMMPAEAARRDTLYIQLVKDRLMKMNANVERLLFWHLHVEPSLQVA